MPETPTVQSTGAPASGWTGAGSPAGSDSFGTEIDSAGSTAYGSETAAASGQDPGSVTLDSMSEADRAQFGTVSDAPVGGWTAAHKTLLARVNAPAPSPLDVPIRFGEQCRATPRTMFAALRANNIEPHPEGPEVDAAFANVLVKLAGIRFKTGTPEESVTVSKIFGAVEGTFPSADEASARTFGDYSQMLADFAAMGGGHLRRFKKADLYWGSLFPVDEHDSASFQFGVQIPTPRTMLDTIAAGNHACLARFTQMVIGCLAVGVKLCPTLFNPGGGATLNAQELQDADDFGGATYGELAVAQKAHRTGYIVPSAEGWDPYYHDVGIPADDDEQTYQKYSLCVWPTEAGEAPDGYASTYYMECCRRKALGVAAFAEGIALYLEAMGSSFSRSSGLGISLREVISYFEAGNEFNVYFKQFSTPAYDLPGLGEATLPLLREVERAFVGYGEREAGRYLALLAGPIRRRVSDARFRHCELASVGDFTIPFSWLADVVAVGMQAEIDLWHARQAAYLLAATTGDRSMMTDSIVAWLASGTDGGLFFWPPLCSELSDYFAVNLDDLVHLLGFHWFAQLDTTKGGDVLFNRPEYVADMATYRDEVALVQTVDDFVTLVVEPLGRAGVDVETAVGAIGFPGRFPTVNPAEGYYNRTSDLFQAAMLVRRLSALAASGVHRANWFCVMLQPSAVAVSGGEEVIANVSLFATMGLHNDVYASTQTYTQDTFGWRRPAWYAFRRLAWLLDQAALIEPVEADGGFILLRVTFKTPVAQGPSGIALPEAYSYAYITWLDQYFDNVYLHPGASASGPVSLVFWLNYVRLSTPDPAETPDTRFPRPTGHGSTTPAIRTVTELAAC